MWDPAQYERYADERGRPFGDLVRRVGARFPRSVVDLGCGTGALTATLADRWPDATVLGVDSSEAMLDRTAPYARPPALTFALGDIGTWEPERPVDVIVSNSALQWIPDHEDVMARLAGFLAPGGWLAVQVPGNFAAPTHTLLGELCRSPRWADRLGGVLRRARSADPTAYLDLLAGAGCAVDAWETTYLHVLGGDEAVFEWVRGTALRPVLAALDDAAAAEFSAEYAALLREAYPPRTYGTVLPFRRVFVVARRTDRAADGGDR